MKQVTVVRVYVTEGEHLYKRLLKMLRGELNANGVTVFRGIAGFGDSGVMHGTLILDTAFDLPLVIEFFDEPAKAQKMIEQINELVAPGQILSWNANINETD